MKKLLLGLLLLAIIVAILLTGITFIGLAVLMMFDDSLSSSIAKITNAITQ